MMGVDATGAAEVVLGSIGVELVEPEMLRTSHDAKPGQRHRRDDRTLAATDGTVAAPGIHDAVRQVELQFHGAAVARGAVPGLDGDAPNFLEHSRPPSRHGVFRSEEHTSELQSLMRISYAVFCL